MKGKLSILLLLFNIHFGYSIYFKQIGTKDGLSQLSVMTIYQDILGRMWFGTEEGLNMYDGKKITIFQPFDQEDKTSLKSSIYGNRVQPITGDNQGNIFFRVDNSLMKYDIRKQSFQLLRKGNVSTLSSRHGEIWVASQDTIYQWDEKSNSLVFMLKTNIPGDEPNLITKIYWDKKERLWLGTTHGLYRTDDKMSFQCVIPNHEIYDVHECLNGDVWVGTRMEGLYRILREGEIIKYTYDKDNSNSIASNQIREFIEDNFGNLWFGTFKGLNKYNPNTERFSVYVKDNLPGGLSHSSVFSLCRDNQGTIWVGTYYGGVNYFNPETDIFKYYAEGAGRNDCLNYPFVGHMVEDNSGNIWICTEGGGLNFLDRKTRYFRHFTDNRGLNSLVQNNLKCISYDPKRNKLYIGTHTGGLSCYDIATDRFTNFLDIIEYSAGKLTSNAIINDIAIYDDKLFFLNNKDGLMSIDLETDKITPVYSDKNNKKPYFGSNFMIDSKGNLWLAQHNGIVRFNLKNPLQQEYFVNEQAGLGRFRALKILETKNKQIYIGTEGSGLFLFDEKNHKFIRFTAENEQLLSNYCYNLAESYLGDLIITSDKGISFFNPEKDITKQVTLTSGLHVNSINAGCGLLVCHNGEIFVGGVDGLTSFFEEDLYKNKKDYNLYFSDLYINNEEVFPNDKNKVLTSDFAFTENLDLNYKQSNLIFTFTTNNYAGYLQKPTYEYMLEGFDHDWITTNQKSIYYTNLSPGDYVLKVREKDVYSLQYPREIQMKLTIHAPYYATIWAFLLYFFLISIAIYSIVRARRSKIRLTLSLKQERKDKEGLEELNHAKLMFFTNISHEFRTPLTLIISQIDLLLQNTSLSPSIYNKVLRIYKNAYHMRNLINELLDFRKLEQKYVTLKVGESNLIEFLKEIYLSFYEYASAHSISYQFESKEDDLLCWFDSEQLQKVFYNLLSNAFKYTKKGGSIKLTVTQTGDEIFVRIIDNGVGIESGELERIFDRFYQVGKNTGMVSSSGRLGTGIGLAISKNIIDLHHGSITVDSHPGYGSIFNVHLKKGKGHFEHDGTIFLNHLEKNAVKPDTLPDPLFMEQMLEVPSPIFQESETNRPTIVIVEDKEELLQILSSLFSPLYTVVLARNGKEGLQKVMEIKPDIVLSDVMMPLMSGTEMCLHIKSNIELSHIPVVLLTALTSAEQNIEGLQRGADDYIGKPFNAKVLLTRCNNLIRSRLLFQKRLNSSQPDFDVQTLANNALDKKFLEKVEKIIEQNLDNTEFDINKLARELAMSRSSLFAKFKALTGLTPNDYILKDKLKRAAILLKNNPELQIAEISDRLGFSSARYFSRCFKIQFNISPLEYRKR